MRTIYWEVECLSCVKVRRRCKRCGGKTEFASSELFRVNANKKKLDVWLVYRCLCCGASWNLPVHERVAPGRLPRGELEGFLQNDAAMARAYAMDAALLARHGCETRSPDYAVAGEDPPVGRPVQVVIRSALPLDVRVSKLLRQKLGLSEGALDALLEGGGICSPGGQDPRRQKLGQSARLVIHLKAPAAEGETS